MCAAVLSFFILIWPLFLMLQEHFPWYVFTMGGVASGAAAIVVAQTWVQRFFAAVGIAATLGATGFLVYIIGPQLWR